MISTRLKATGVALVLCGLAVRTEAADGILIVQTTTSPSGVSTTQSQITKTKMRTDITGTPGQSQVVMFDGERQVLTMVDMAQRTYREMTKADADRTQQQMQGMMAQMQSLPPAVRAQMEARGIGAAPTTPAKREYRRNGSDRVGRWACDKYDVLQNGSVTGSICTVAPAALGVALTDFDVAQQMASFFASAMPQMANQVSVVGKIEDQGFSGFPVKQVTTVAGQTVTMELTDIKRQALDDALFVVPAGFTKQDMPGMPGARGGRGR